MKVHSLVNGHVIFEETVYDTTYYLSNGMESTDINELTEKLNKRTRYVGIFTDEQSLRLAHLGFRRTYGKYRPGERIHGEVYKKDGGEFEIDIEDGKNVRFTNNLELDLDTLQSLVGLLNEIK